MRVIKEVPNAIGRYLHYYSKGCDRSYKSSYKEGGEIIKNLYCPLPDLHEYVLLQPLRILIIVERKDTKGYCKSMLQLAEFSIRQNPDKTYYWSTFPVLSKLR